MPNVGQGKKTEEQVNIIICLLEYTINKWKKRGKKENNDARGPINLSNQVILQRNYTCFTFLIPKISESKQKQLKSRKILI